MRGVLAKVIVATLLFSFPAEARGPYGSIKVGNWTGGAFTNDTTGQFSGCIAGAPYLSGIFFKL